jgi:GLPGLI family protein
VRKALPIFILVGLLVSACKYANPKFINEGVIEYDAKVVNEDHPMAGLMPNKMSVKFKNDLFAAEMSVMGVFNTVFITDPKKKTLTTLVKMFDVKQACIEEEKALVAESNNYKLDLKETNETKIIAGYTCKKVIATMADDPSIKFDVYYTDELNVTAPNFSNPYSKINGMLMEYRLKKFDIEMTFTAKGVTKEEIPNESFELPAYYKVISKKEMDEYFKALQ